MNIENPLYSDACDANSENTDNKIQSKTQQCTLTDEFSDLTKENETHGEYDEGSYNDEHEKEQKEKTKQKELNERCVPSDKDKDHHGDFTTTKTKTQEQSSKYHDNEGYFSDVSGSPKLEEDKETFIYSSGSVSSQEDSECFRSTSSLTKQEDKGYFSHSSGSTSHSSSSEKLEHDNGQNLDEDEDNCSNNEYSSSSSEKIKEDSHHNTKDEDADNFEFKEHIYFDISDDYKEEWHTPAVPSNSPTDQVQTIASQSYKSGVDVEVPIKLVSVKDYADDRFSFSKKSSFTHGLQNIFKDQIPVKYKHQDIVKGTSTPPLPPNTLAPSSQVTYTQTTIQARYPPPNTSAIYYDSLPEPEEEVTVRFKEKKKKIEQEEFINVLRDKLRKLLLLTGGSKNKKHPYHDVCDTHDVLEDDNDNHECDKGLKTDKGLKRPPLKRQSSFNLKLPERNLSNLTEVLTNLHTTQTELKRSEHVTYKDSLTLKPEEETNVNKKVLVKSSSLKYDKTPPDQKQQSKKKIVKFADVFGMDLVEVRTFMAGTPAISRSSFTDTQVELPTSSKTRSLRSLFDAPILKPNFWDRVNKEKVCLEQMFIGKDLGVKGIIRVLNLTCEKRVIIRHSFDNWKNYHETTATYLSGSSDGRTDQFSFLLWGNFLQDNGTLVFCIRYQTSGQEFWDNNQGEDYKLQCYAMPSHVQAQGQERSSRSRQQSSQYLSAQSESLYSEFERLRDHSPADPWLQRYL